MRAVEDGSPRGHSRRIHTALPRPPSRVAAPPLEAKVDRPDVEAVELAPRLPATRERHLGDRRVQELHSLFANHPLTDARRQLPLPIDGEV
jgi:hypothetical protein